MATRSTRQAFSTEQIRDRIVRYCAYQERSHMEVRRKLSSLGTPADEAEALMVFLIGEGFLNEERFARAFARGKFRMKNWGRIRIVNDLEARGVSRNCITLGLTEIDHDEYMKTLEKVLKVKASDTHDPSLYMKRNKVATFAIRKGFEPELVWETVRDLLPDN